MSTQLAVVDSAADEAPTALAAKPRHFPLTPKTLPELLQLGAMLAKSGLMPDAVRTPEAAAAIVLKGSELGLPPMASIEGISIIKGKPTCGAHLMLALVKRDYGQGAIRVAQSTATECVVEWREQGWPGVQSYTYTMDDARTAGLANNDNWKKHPKAMLRARCISAVAKMAFPECVGGLYVPDELGADVTVTDAGEVVIVDAGGQPQRTEARPSPVAGGIPLYDHPGFAAMEAGHTVDAETGEIVDADVSDAKPSLGHLHGIAAERNLDHAALKVLSLRWFGVESMKDLTVEQIGDLELLVKRFQPEEWPVLLRMVEGQDDTGFGVLMGHAVDLADAQTGADLKRIFKAMTDGGVTDPALMAVGARRKDQLKRLAEMGP